MKTEKTYILEAGGLSIGYKKGDPLFSSIDLCAGDGELICILGPNGIGKSTLIKTLSGLIDVLDGKLVLGGKAFTTLTSSQRARLLSLVLTIQPVHGSFTVFELVALGRFPYTNWLGQLSGSDKEIIQSAIEKTGIGHLIHKKIHELSDGERQKAIIARAIAQDTAMMILDEPTAFLDVKNRVEVMKLLRDLASLDGRTVILSTHEVSLALKYADVLWLMGEEGTFLKGTVTEVSELKLLEKIFGTEVI